MIRVASYCRVSTDQEDQANSFVSQQLYFRQYVQRQPDWELYEIYADEGISGTSTKKRGLRPVAPGLRRQERKTHGGARRGGACPPHLPQIRR